MKKQKPHIKPVILGMHPNNGEKRILKLHNHPTTILNALKDLMEMAEQQELKDVFEDAIVLTQWALKKLPLVPPPTEKGDATEQSETPPTTKSEENSPQS